MKNKWLLLIFLLLAVSGVALAAEESVIKTNDAGEFTIAKPMLVGGITLPAGTYMLHSHVAGTTHDVHVEQEQRTLTVHPETFEEVYVFHVAEVPCSAAALPSKAERTALHVVDEGERVRLVRVEVAGEDHRHVL